MRRAPVKVAIGDQEFSAALLTCGLSRQFAGELRALREATMKVAKGETLSLEEENAYSVAAIAVVSALLQVNHPECTQEWVKENVFDHELGVILGKVWRASAPPDAGGGGSPEAHRP